jgi:hypothetical protein
MALFWIVHELEDGEHVVRIQRLTNVKERGIAGGYGLRMGERRPLPAMCRRGCTACRSL